MGDGDSLHAMALEKQANPLNRKRGMSEMWGSSPPTVVRGITSTLASDLAGATPY
jgi:hypothetical protein